MKSCLVSSLAHSRFTFELPPGPTSISPPRHFYPAPIRATCCPVCWAETKRCQWWRLGDPLFFPIGLRYKCLSSTNQKELTLAHWQSEGSLCWPMVGSAVAHPFCQILILKSVGWDIGCQSSTNQEALWLNQSGGSLYWPMGGLQWPYPTVGFQFGAPWSEILALENLVCEVIENPQSQTSLRSSAKSPVAD